MNGSDQELADLIAPHVGKTGGLLVALRAVQNTFGFLPSQTRAVAADLFNLSLAEVRGVISFYADFSEAPKPAKMVRICAAEACQAVGAVALFDEADSKFSGANDQSDYGDSVSVERVYCLGLCSCGPAAMVNGRLIGRATTARIKAALADA